MYNIDITKISNNNNMTYELKSNGVVIETFETAQDAIDYGDAYYEDGYIVTSK